MKTIRTIIATLSVELLAFTLVAWVSVRRNAAYIQRTIYQGFDQTFVVALVMGCAFLLIAVILTVAIASTGDDEEDDGYDEDDEREMSGSRRRYEREPERRTAPKKGEEPYRRVSRDRTMEPHRSGKAPEEDSFTRPRERGEDRDAAQRTARKRDKAAERPDEIDLRQDDAPVKRPRKAARPAPLPEDDFVEVPEPAAPRPQPKSRPKPQAPARKEDPQPTMEEAPQEKAEERPVEAAQPGPMAEEKPVEAAGSTPETVDTIPEAEKDLANDAQEPQAAAEEAVAGPEEESQSEPLPKDPTVRCIFCGRTLGRSDVFCPNCGKKR